MSKNKKDIEKQVVNDSAGGVETREGGFEARGGDISAVKFGSIFLALGICIVLMVIAKLMGL